MQIGSQEILLPTTMVGNYPNPRWYDGHAFATFPNGEFVYDSISREAFEDAVGAIVHDQEAAGLDIISDGKVYGGDSPYGQILYHYTQRMSGYKQSGPPIGLPIYSTLFAPSCVGEVRREAPFHLANLRAVRKATKKPVKISYVGIQVLAAATNNQYYKETRELGMAISQNQARHHIASLVGGPLGGVLYAVAKPLPFLVDAVTYAFSLLTVSRVRADLSPVDRPRRTPVRELGDGLRYLLVRPYFRSVAAFSAAINLVVNAVFFVAIVRLVEAGIPSTTIGLVEALAGIGGIVGALIAPFVIDRMRTGHLTMSTAWLWVPLLVPLIFWSSPWLVGAMLCIGLLLNPAGNAAAQSYRVAITPDELQGRIASSSQFLSFTTIPLAPLLGGWLLETYGAEAATTILLVAAALAALIPTLARSVRSVPRPRDWPVLDESGHLVEQAEREAPGLGSGIDDDEVVALDRRESGVAASV